MENLIALQPYLLLAAAALGVLLLIALKRSLTGVYLLTLTGFYTALASLWPAARHLEPSSTPFLSLDRYTVFPMTLVLASGIIATILVKKSVKNTNFAEESFFFLLIATLGGAILVTTNHFLMLLIGLKLLSLPIYVLLAGARENALRIRAAVKIFIVGEVFSAVLLFNVALIYLKTGTLQISTVFTPMPAGLISAGLVLALIVTIFTVVILERKFRKAF